MRFISFIAFLSICISLNAQESKFSDAKLFASHYNQALLGTTYGLEFTHITQYQYSKYYTEYTHHFLQGNFGFEKRKMWIGDSGYARNYRNYSSDKYFGISGSKFVNVCKTFSIRLGLNAGIASKHERIIDYDASTIIKETRHAFDANAGIHFNLFRFAIGYSIHHFPQSEFKFSRNQYPYNLEQIINTGYDIPMKLLNKFCISDLFSSIQLARIGIITNASDQKQNGMEFHYKPRLTIGEAVLEQEIFIKTNMAYDTSFLNSTKT